jgi:hypothetical protein
LHSKELPAFSERPETKHPACDGMLVNLQPFFYGRSFTDIAQEKDTFKTIKRCIGLMGIPEILLT